MENKITIIIAEDDDGHALLIKRNLIRSGISNPILHFRDGEEVVNFFFNDPPPYLEEPGMNYIILLDIKMPKIDGIEVLEKLKQNEELKKIPVIMITTTDNPKEIETCHKLGCNSYIVKPIDYVKFIEVVKRLGYFLEIVQIPNP
jgi:CheY-like chemotaxis protein